MFTRLSSTPLALMAVFFTVEDAWHCHNVANTREVLWEHTAGWIDDVLNTTD